MAKITRLTGCTDCIDLGFVECERTPRELMAINIHLDGLSLSNTVRELEKFRLDRRRTAVHDWVHKANLTPVEGASPDQVALDETIIGIDCQQYWLYASIDPATTQSLHFRLFLNRTTALTEIIFKELTDKHDISDAVFLVDSAPWLKAALHRRGSRFRYERHGMHNSVERVYAEIKRLNTFFTNSFRHVDLATADSRLRAFACWHNATN